MKSAKKALVGILVLAALGIGYALGTYSNGSVAYAGAKTTQAKINQVVGEQDDPPVYQILDESRKVVCYTYYGTAGVGISCAKY